MTDVILWTLGLIMSIILTILLTEPINYLLAKVFGGWVKINKGLRGIWKANNKVISQGKERRNIRYFKVKQFGNFVIAESLTKIDGTYKLKGKLDSKLFFSGNWSEITSDKREYKGVFQLILGPHGTEMKGKYLSYNRNQEIIDGDWNWKLETREKNKGVIDKYENMNPKEELNKG